jgi:hypothetical protein
MGLLIKFITELLFMSYAIYAAFLKQDLSIRDLALLLAMLISMSTVNSFNIDKIKEHLKIK